MAGWRNPEQIELVYTAMQSPWTQPRCQLRNISADGRKIVGYGTNPDGNTEGWLAVLPASVTIAPFGTAAATLGVTVKGRAEVCVSSRSLLADV